MFVNVSYSLIELAEVIIDAFFNINYQILDQNFYISTYSYDVYECRSYSYAAIFIFIKRLYRL